MRLIRLLLRILIILVQYKTLKDESSEKYIYSPISDEENDYINYRIKTI